MAAPGSGELSLLKLAREKLYDNYNSSGVVQSAISLKFLTIGGTGSPMHSGTSFDTTNTQSPNHPDNSTGYGMGEFYAYDHDFQSIPCNKAMDVVFVLDYTGSMEDDMTTLKSNVASISNKVIDRSGGDYRLSIVLVDQNFQSSYTPPYWSNNTAAANLASQYRYSSGGTFLTALVPFANANKSDFDTKVSYLAQSTNDEENMTLGSGAGTPEPSDTALDRILNNNFVGSFRSGVQRMIILVTDAAPDADGDDAFNGAEEISKMDSLTATAVANVTTISIVGNISNSTASDGTRLHDLYNSYATNTGGSANFSGSPSNINSFIDSICNGIEQPYASFSSETTSSIDATMTNGVNVSNFTTSGGTFTMNASDFSHAGPYWWKAYYTNSAGTSYSDVKKVDGSKFTMSVSVTNPGGYSNKGFITHTSEFGLIANGTSHSNSASSNNYSNTVNLSGTPDHLGWVMCNSQFSSTPIISVNSSGEPADATGMIIYFYTGTVSTGTNLSRTFTGTGNIASQTFVSGNTYKTRGYMIKNGVIQYTAIKTNTIAASADYTATLTTGWSTFYTTTGKGYYNGYPFNMGSLSNTSFNGGTIQAMYYNDGSSTDWTYIVFSGTKKSWTAMSINGQDVGASSTWTSTSSSTWRKNISTNLFGSSGSSISITASY